MTGDLNDVSPPHLLVGPRARQHQHLFSIEGGAQENMVEGGAGEIARRAVGLETPYRLTSHLDRPARRPRGVKSRAVDVSASRRRRARGLAWRSVDQCCRGWALYRNSVADRSRRRSSSTTNRSGEQPVSRTDRAEFGCRGHARRHACHRSSGYPRVHVRARRGTRRCDGRNRTTTRRDRSVDGAARTASRAARRGDRDTVVEAGVDARVFDGAPHARHPDALRLADPCALRTRALGGHGDIHDLARRDRRRGPLR